MRQLRKVNGYPGPSVSRHDWKEWRVRRGMASTRITGPFTRCITSMDSAQAGGYSLSLSRDAPSLTIGGEA